MLKKIVALALLVFLPFFLIWQGSLDRLDKKLIAITGANHEPHEFEVWLATDPETQAKGLMGVKSMEKNQGMLFVKEQPGIMTFWMKDTYIPLDMIFINDKREVVFIYTNAVPQDSKTIISSVYLVKYVLEINGGLTEELGIAVGDKVEGDF